MDCPPISRVLNFANLSVIFREICEIKHLTKLSGFTVVICNDDLHFMVLYKRSHKPTIGAVIAVDILQMWVLSDF